MFYVEGTDKGIIYKSCMNMSKKEKNKYSGKALYQPTGKAGEYAQWAVNFFTGCSNDCDYCYCKHGVLSAVWGGEPKLKKVFKNENDAFEHFRKEVLPNRASIIRNGGVFFSFMTDPCLKETWPLTMRCIEYLIIRNIPVMVLTKCTEWIDDAETMNLVKIDKAKEFLCVGFTLTGEDAMEHGAAPNSDRIAAMQFLHGQGIKTFASLEPVIDFELSYKMLESTYGFCDMYKIGLQSGVSRSTYTGAMVSSFVDRISSYIMAHREFSPKVYWKESVRKYLPKDYACLSLGFCVNAKYNIFKGK